MAGAGDERKHAGLAHAVRADQPDHAAGCQIKANRIEGVYLAAAQANVRQSGHRRPIEPADDDGAVTCRLDDTIGFTVLHD